VRSGEIDRSGGYSRDRPRLYENAYTQQLCAINWRAYLRETINGKSYASEGNGGIIFFGRERTLSFYTAPT
jgi:hypothetical protein